MQLLSNQLAHREHWLRPWARFMVCLSSRITTANEQRTISIRYGMFPSKIINRSAIDKAVKTKLPCPLTQRWNSGGEWDCGRRPMVSLLRTLTGCRLVMQLGKILGIFQRIKQQTNTWIL